MITISTSGNSILFTFEDSQHYLYGNGEITTPKNSLILVTDSSEMATFKKIDGDIFLSALYSELGMTKSELISYYEANMVGSTGGGGGGVTSGEVQTMIDESISAVTESISGLTERIGEDEEVTSAGLNALNDSISGLTERIGEDEEVTAAGLNALNDALSGKVSTSAITSAVTSASTDSEIPTAKAVYDAIPTGGTGASYSAGTGINIDSANTITAVYNGYISFDNPQSSLSDYSGELYIKAPWYDCVGQTTGSCNFYTEGVSDAYRYEFRFTPANKSYELKTYPEGHQNDWESYFTIEFDDSVGLFKVTTLQTVNYIQDTACVRLFRIGSGYTDYSINYSGTTNDAFNAAFDNFNDYLNEVYLSGNGRQFYVYGRKKYGYTNQYALNLDDLVIENSRMRTDIKVGTGTYGWSDMQHDGCYANPDNIERISSLRISGTSEAEMYYYNMQWQAIIENYASGYDSLIWDDTSNEFVLTSSWFYEGGPFETPTVTYDSTAHTVTVEYPSAVTIDGNSYIVYLNSFYNNNCRLESDIKIESWGEIKEPLIQYVQETREEASYSAGTGIDITNNVISVTGGTGGGNPTVELTQAEYDALVTAGTVSADTYYIITDAPAVTAMTSGDVESMITEATSGFVSTSAITSAVTSASTDSEIPTAKAVWEAASGGGSTYTAGRGIKITNDTISVSLPISAGTGTDSIVEGYGTIASGERSYAEGYSTKALGKFSHTEGSYTSASTVSNVAGVTTYYGYEARHAEGSYTLANNASTHTEGYDTIANNFAEHASGSYNVSNSATTTFGDSGNTLFSVGNGTANNARHNAFEIRQNGDIYLSSGGTDIKLQDHLGGGSVQTTSAVTSGSTACLTSGGAYEQLDGLKLQKVTQQEYDALVSGGTVDNNTLYIVTDS